jgi:protein TonB
MPADRTLYRSPIVVSVLLHAAVIAPVLLISEPPGLTEGTGTSGLIVTFADDVGATGAAGAETPDIETIDAGPNPDEVSATMVEPEEVAAEVEPEPVDADVVTAVEPPIAEPDAAEDSEPESVPATEPATTAAAKEPTVTAAAPDEAEPESAPAPEPPAQTPTEAAEVPLEEIHAQPPQQQAEAPAEPVETIAAADAATVAKAQEPPKEKPAEKGTKKPPAKSDSVETAERTTTTGEQQDDVPKTKAGDSGDGSAYSGSDVAAIDSAIRRGMVDYQFLLQAWLEKHKKYPRRAKQRHWQSTVVLHFTIDRAGKCPQLPHPGELGPRGAGRGGRGNDPPRSAAAARAGGDAERQARVRRAGAVLPEVRTSRRTVARLTIDLTRRPAHHPRAAERPPAGRGTNRPTAR